MSQSETTRTVAAPIANASDRAHGILARIRRAWKLAADVARESRAMEERAWHTNRLPHNGW